MKNCPICGEINASFSKHPFVNDYLGCPRCGGFFSQNSEIENLNPAPPSENNEKVYFYSKKVLFAKGLNLLEKMLSSVSSRKLLDIGCGFGYFMKMAQERGWSCEGVEISPAAINYCRDRLNLTVYDKPLKELNFPSESFDVVSMWGVLDVLPAPFMELKEIYRILKPQGILLIRVNNFTFHSIAFRLGQTSLLRRWKVAPGVIHRYGINHKALRCLLSDAGFTAIKIFNSLPTRGDPYGTGGKVGSNIVAALKMMYYFLTQIIYFLTLKKITISSALVGVGVKNDAT